MPTLKSIDLFDKEDKDFSFSWKAFLTIVQYERIGM